MRDDARDRKDRITYSIVISGLDALLGDQWDFLWTATHFCEWRMFFREKIDRVDTGRQYVFFHLPGDIREMTHTS